MRATYPKNIQSTLKAHIQVIWPQIIIKYIYKNKTKTVKRVGISITTNMIPAIQVTISHPPRPYIQNTIHKRSSPFQAFLKKSIVTTF